MLPDMSKTSAGGPLTPAVFHILLALSGGPCHGYGVMKQVALDSGGAVTMGPGTLYGSIGRMLDVGLIREGGTRIDPALDDDRRIYYELTAAGRSALAAELARYRDVVAVAASRLVDPS
jgi:DNA-binding PadR family transcriptional regulator